MTRIDIAKAVSSDLRKIKQAVGHVTYPSESLHAAFHQKLCRFRNRTGRNPNRHERARIWDSVRKSRVRA